MYIARDLETALAEALQGRKVVILYGSRQTGKTTLIEHLLENDTGIRNAVIGNFLPLDVREDTGHLFENYLIAERMKSNQLAEREVQAFFWRTKGGGANELDYLEESAEKGLVGYEFKWNPAKAVKAKCPKVFAEAYPEAEWHCVSRDNYVEFIQGMI